MSNRHAMWTPLPPARSGIADYSAELLPHLRQLTDICAVTPDHCTAPSGVQVLGPERTRAGTTLNCYHMGNHAGAHSRIYEQALADPGFVVLHDTSLLDFYATYFDGIASAAFRHEVEHAHGPIWGDPGDPALLEGWPTIEVDGVQTLDRRTLTLERRLVDNSRAVLVHDPFSAEQLRERYPEKPIYTVLSGTDIKTDSRNSDAKKKMGFETSDVVFGVFGGLGKIKRPMVTLLAFARVRKRWPQARLLISGHSDDTSVVAEINQLVADFAIDDSVHIELSPEKAAFEDLIMASDAVVNLRWPTAGETSAVMMRAFGAGKPVITSDLPQHQHFDSTFCWRVPTDPEYEAQTLIRLLERALLHPEHLHAAGSHAREFVRREASWPVVANQYREALETERERMLDTRPRSRPVRSRKRVGVNLFADARATTGLAEAARRHLAALDSSPIGTTFTEFNTGAANRSLTLPRGVAGMRRGKEYPVDLWFVNVNEFQLVPEHALDRYTIALWAWELPEAPLAAQRHLSRINELWVVSSYVAQAFRTITEIPIRVLPNIVEPPPETIEDRASFGLPHDRLLVLFTFSASSSDARKNPWAVIDCFIRAFGTDPGQNDAHLVMKVNDLHRFPDLANELSSAMSKVGGTLITDELRRSDMDSLLQSCDIYLSLHRSEGFGLGMAEAMSFGKPVIATAYGGNLDFMPHGSAIPVGYDIRKIEEADHRLGPEFLTWYETGQLWAEPNVEQASRWLRWLANSDERRSVIGKRGAETIRTYCDSERVGLAMSDRITEICNSLDGRIHTDSVDDP